MNTIKILSPKECRAARILLGCDQKDLARELNLSHVYISNFEIGRHKPSLQFAKTIYDFFYSKGVRFEEDEVKIQITILK